MWASLLCNIFMVVSFRLVSGRGINLTMVYNAINPSTEAPNCYRVTESMLVGRTHADISVRAKSMTRAIILLCDQSSLSHD